MNNSVLRIVQALKVEQQQQQSTPGWLDLHEQSNNSSMVDWRPNWNEYTFVCVCSIISFYAGIVIVLSMLGCVLVR